MFSHIYIEEKALNYPVTQAVLNRFNTAVKITVRHYKDVFNRSNQDFQLQKANRKLLLAVKQDNFLYKGPDICQNFGKPNFFYTSTLMNCIYDCDYCYLQGMYPSANMVAFVNTDDFLNAASSLDNYDSSYLAVSYETDLMAFEGIIPYTAIWIGFAGKHRNIDVEIRTKSSNYNAIAHLGSIDNIILAWTLTPEAAAAKYEKQAPPLNARLKAISRALADGWKVRLCFDPVLKLDNWKEAYADFLNTVFTSLPAERIKDVSIGAFRMPGEYLKNIRKARFDSDLVYYPFECKNGISAYPSDMGKELTGYVYDNTAKYFDKTRIFC